MAKMTQPPKCAECDAKGDRYKVYEDQFMTSTAMAGSSWWDEDGKHHSHDPNWHSRGYSCSNGHRWSESWQSECPACGKVGF